MYDVSVLICTYNPDIIKLKKTISSVLLQENIKVQIVVSDDGSEDFPRQEIEDFFNEYQFLDYRFSLSERNQGTVKNVINGTELCDGKYLKLISPGDYLYQQDVLCQWFKLLEESNAQLSLSDAIYYRENDDDHGVTPYRVRLHPQADKNYYHNEWYYNYLVFEDNALGAATICKTDAAQKYLSLINGKVKYAEDNIYRLMALDKLTMVYFHGDSILYEYGTGISTSANDIWHKRLLDDWDATTDIILNRIKEDDELSVAFKKSVALRKKTGLKYKIIRNISINGMFKEKTKWRIFPRYSNMKIDNAYINRLSQMARENKALDSEA